MANIIKTSLTYLNIPNNMFTDFKAKILYKVDSYNVLYYIGP